MEGIEAVVLASAVRLAVGVGDVDMTVLGVEALARFTLLHALFAALFTGCESINLGRAWPSADASVVVTWFVMGPDPLSCFLLLLLDLTCQGIRARLLR